MHVRLFFSTSFKKVHSAPHLIIRTAKVFQETYPHPEAAGRVSKKTFDESSSSKENFIFKSWPQFFLSQPRRLFSQQNSRRRCFIARRPVTTQTFWIARRLPRAIGGHFAILMKRHFWPPYRAAAAIGTLRRHAGGHGGHDSRFFLSRQGGSIWTLH